MSKPNPRSHINVSLLEGNLVSDPVTKETTKGRVTEASIASTEQWLDQAGQLKEHTSFLGLVAHGPASEMLSLMQQGQAVVVFGRWRTVEGDPGPRGGKTTSTKLRVIHILPKIKSELFAQYLAFVTQPAA